MEFGYVSSPSQSPNQSIFAAGHFFDSTSESSSPSSPNMGQIMYNNIPMQYDMCQYSVAPSHFYAATSNSKASGNYTPTASGNSATRRVQRTQSTPITAKDKDTMPGMHMRRRAQNRASQRAFRERKEKHVKGLEHQLEDLHEKHQDLLQSYARQTDEVSKLNNRISELDAELTTLRSCHDRSYDDMLMPDRFDKFDHFDAFSLHDTLYSGPYLDKSGVDLDSESAYHNFEDSL